jgi:hypothetical protein
MGNMMMMMMMMMMDSPLGAPGGLGGSLLVQLCIAGAQLVAYMGSV